MIGIIGGTGLYRLDGLEVSEEREVETPFGPPSAPLVFGRVGANDVVFLPRHGRGHTLLPMEVNYRANIWALKSVGVTALLTVSATGSLREELEPGHLVVPDQYIDMAIGSRAKSFFGNGIAAHLSTAQVLNPQLRDLLASAAQRHDLPLHLDRTYVCVEGPRLGTRAESFAWRTLGADLVGMTQVPEVFLAKEAQLAAATVCVVTDYDCWMDDPEHHVTVQQVLERYGEALDGVRRLLFEVLASPVEVPRPMETRSAILTPEDHWGDHRAMLEVLLA